MHSRLTTLLSLAAAAALAANATAQNDDCTGAISVGQGANGPYTNVGATTSTPAWPCALGGNDVWFVYVAPGAGSLTADTCGGSYDSCIEIFDGTAGCGSLLSLGCNDDSCGLQSSLTVTVTTGTTYFIRVGGFNSSTGTFPLNINGPLPSGSTVATKSTYGAGCVARAGSFYELFPTVANHDLANTAMTLINTGSGYLALPIGTYVAPSATATALVLTDDSETTTPTLAAPFAYPGGTTSAFTVCSNGFVSVASGNGTDYSPASVDMLAHSQTAYYVGWHDFNPGTAGSGAVKFEEIGGIAYITWDGVWSFGRTAGPGDTMQLQFDEATGNVTYVWVSVDPQGSSTNAAAQHLVGFHVGGQTQDPGTRDISTTLPATFTCGRDLNALSFNSSARPLANSTISLDTNNLAATTPFGAVLLSLSQFNPGIDLTGLGMAGCSQFQGGEVTLLFLPFGSPTASVPFTVPNAVGLHIYAQSFAYDPASGLTLLGAIASNGLDLGIGNI